MSPQNILLFGATGTIGSFILNAILAQRSQFGRIAIFTSQRTAETKGEQLKKQGVEVIVGDLEDETAVKAAYEGKYIHPSHSVYFKHHPQDCKLMPTRNNNHHLSPRPQHPRPTNPPNPPRRHQLQCEMVLPIRVRHRYRLQSGLDPRKAPPAETQSARCAGK